MRMLLLFGVAIWAVGYGSGAFCGLKLRAAEAGGAPQVPNGAPAAVSTESVVEALKKKDGQAIEQLGPAAYDALVAALKEEVVRSDAVFYSRVRRLPSTQLPSNPPCPLTLGTEHPRPFAKSSNRWERT